MEVGDLFYRLECERTQMKFVLAFMRAESVYSIVVDHGLTAILVLNSFLKRKNVVCLCLCLFVVISSRDLENMRFCNFL